MTYGPLGTVLPLQLPYLRDQVWYKFHWSRTTNIKVIEQKSTLIFWKPTKGHNSKCYGPLAPLLVYTIHPVIAHVYTNFQLSLVPEKSVTKIFKNGKIWKPIKGHKSKSYGPLATILPLHLPYLRDQVLYKVHWSRTTNIKVIKQNAF